MKQLKDTILESEVAVFWDEISQHLPKSVERSALGDEKIFRAFYVAYPKIKSYLRDKIFQAVEEIVNNGGDEVYDRKKYDAPYEPEMINQERNRIRQEINKLK